MSQSSRITKQKQSEGSKLVLHRNPFPQCSSLSAVELPTVFRHPIAKKNPSTLATPSPSSKMSEDFSIFWFRCFFAFYAPLDHIEILRFISFERKKSAFLRLRLPWLCPHRISSSDVIERGQTTLTRWKRFFFQFQFDFSAWFEYFTWQRESIKSP